MLTAYSQCPHWLYPPVWAFPGWALPQGLLCGTVLWALSQGAGWAGCVEPLFSAEHP